MEDQYLSIRVVKHIALWLFIVFPAMLSGIITIPLGLILKSGDRLPKILFWWDNYEDGIYGDQYYQYMNNGKSFWSAYKWLAFRNPVHNLTHITLAKPVYRTLLDRVRSDNPDIEVGDYSSGGDRLTCSLTEAGEDIFEYYLVRPYTIAKIFRLCIRVRIGYKHGFYFGKSVPNVDINLAPYVFSVNPFHPYRGV